MYTAQYQYELTTGGIHIFTTFDDSRDTTEHFLRELEGILLDRQTSRKAYPLLLDYSNASPLPINYTLTRLRACAVQIDQGATIYFAIVINNRMLEGMLERLIKALPLKVELLITPDRQAAKRWLEGNLLRHA